MRPEEYERMYTLENTYWWFQGRKDIVLALLLRHTPLGDGRPAVLDVGCGTGLMLETLRAYSQPVGVDFSRLAMDFCRRRGIERLACGRVEALPFDDNAFDLITALDLLEHIEDDEELIRELWRVCRPGGHLFVSVPAYPFLWSEHDEALHHYRRYTRRSLKRLIAQTDFEVLRFTSAISFTLLPVTAFRIVQKVIKRKGRPKTHLIHLPGAVNRTLIGMLRLEARWLRRFNFPAGVSLLALLRKGT